MDDPEESNNGVVVSEDFQKKTHELVHKASKHELHHVRDRVYDREDALRKEEQNSDKKNKKPNANIQFTTADMPKG
jgi:hypothetical protein